VTLTPTNLPYLIDKKAPPTDVFHVVQPEPSGTQPGKFPGCCLIKGQRSPRRLPCQPHDCDAKGNPVHHVVESDERRASPSALRSVSRLRLPQGGGALRPLVPSSPQENASYIRRYLKQKAEAVCFKWLYNYLPGRKSDNARLKCEGVARPPKTPTVEIGNRGNAVNLEESDEGSSGLLLTFGWEPAAADEQEADRAVFLSPPSASATRATTSHRFLPVAN